MSKAALRRKLAARRRRVPPQQAAAAAARCRELVRALPRLAEASRVALYAALPGEIDTRRLFEELAAAGHRLLLPRVVGEGLEFAPVARWQELVTGPRRALEPPPQSRAEALAPGDWVLLPGLAFDREGWRLGRGGGHYDRALAAAPGVRAVGLAYAFQLVEAVPHDSHDRPVDAIVTEEGMVCARRR